MWEGLYCFLLFSCGDWAGRLLAGALAGCGARFFESGAILKLLILSRLVFLPLFMLCNHEHTRWPIVFAHDVFPIGFMVLFSISNGAARPPEPFPLVALYRPAECLVPPATVGPRS